MPEVFCDQCCDGIPKRIVIYDYITDKYLCEKCLLEKIRHYNDLIDDLNKNKKD